MTASVPTTTVQAAPGPTPAHIGYAAVFLASESARYLTDVSLPVDGGNSIGF